MRFEEYDELICMAHEFKPFENARVCVSSSSPAYIDISYRWIDSNQQRHGIAQSFSIAGLSGFVKQADFVFAAMKNQAIEYQKAYDQGR